MTSLKIKEKDIFGFSHDFHRNRIYYHFWRFLSSGWRNIIHFFAFFWLILAKNKSTPKFRSGLNLIYLAIILTSQCFSIEILGKFLIYSLPHIQIWADK